jgi:predicted nucleic acid-binding protein
MINIKITRKIKVYLDTSVISHLDQPEKPVEQEETFELWDNIVADAFDVCMSQVVMDELDECDEQKRLILYSYIDMIKFTLLPKDDEVLKLAYTIIDNGILPQKCMDDCMHIAAAVIAKCDFLLSWNLKHLARHKTNKGIRSIVIPKYHSELLIITPKQLREEMSNEKNN